MDRNPQQSGTESESERPPLFSTWWHVYAAVLVAQGLLIAVFYLFTRAFR